MCLRFRQICSPQDGIMFRPRITLPIALHGVYPLLNCLRIHGGQGQHSSKDCRPFDHFVMLPRRLILKLHHKFRENHVSPSFYLPRALTIGICYTNSLTGCYEEQHPIILPRHRISDLLIARAHKATLHGGAQLVTLRQQFWILGCRSSVKNCIRHCVTCVRHTSLPCSQLVGNLPSARVNLFPPF